MCSSDLEDLNLFKFVDDPASALKVLQDSIEADTVEKTPAFACTRLKP